MPSTALTCGFAEEPGQTPLFHPPEPCSIRLDPAGVTTGGRASSGSSGGSSEAIARVASASQNRARQDAARRTKRNHPRGRGRRRLGTGRTAPLRGGPSPRVQGADRRHAAHQGLHGTIPAGTGSSRAGESWTGRCRDHPCKRGEQESAVRSLLVSRGPSPRAREVATHDQAGVEEAGAIPAGARSTPRDFFARSCSRDHPRGREEQMPVPRLTNPLEGSSPRTQQAWSSRC